MYTEAGARRASECAPPSGSLFHLPAWLSHPPREQLTVSLLAYLCSALTVYTARAPVAYAQVQKMELSYQCGDVVAPALLGDAVTHALTELGYAIVRPIVVSESGETALLNVHCAHHARSQAKPTMSRHMLCIQGSGAAVALSAEQASAGYIVKCGCRHIKLHGICYSDGTQAASSLSRKGSTLSGASSHVVCQVAECLPLYQQRRLHALRYSTAEELAPSCARAIRPACLTALRHPAQAALSSQLPSAAAGTSAVVLAALRDAYPAEVMNLASNLDMNVRPAIPPVHWPVMCRSPLQFVKQELPDARFGAVIACARESALSSAATCLPRGAQLLLMRRPSWTSRAGCGGQRGRRGARCARRGTCACWTSPRWASTPPWWSWTTRRCRCCRAPSPATRRRANPNPHAGLMFPCMC